MLEPQLAHLLVNSVFVEYFPTIFTVSASTSLKNSMESHPRNSMTKARFGTSWFFKDGISHSFTSPTPPHPCPNGQTLQAINSPIKSYPPFFSIAW